MRISNKFLSFFAGVVSLGIAAGACNKPAKIQLAGEGTIYMPQAVGLRGDLSLVLIDSPQYVTFGAAYGGLQYPSQDITVTFKIDTAAVAAYNLANGTSYVVLPSSSYSADTLTTIIPAGKTSSNPLYVAVRTNMLSNSGTAYMLPITLASTSKGSLNSSLTTAYFAINQLNNIYAGSYNTTGTRNNFNADGSAAGTSPISDTRVLTTMSADSCSINTIANLGAYNGTVFYVRVNSGNTLEFSGALQNNPASPIANQPGTTSTYDPATRIFTVHYMYTNTNGTYRRMDEVWTPK
jgi:hypothetical protein